MSYCRNKIKAINKLIKFYYECSSTKCGKEILRKKINKFIVIVTGHSECLLINIKNHELYINTENNTYTDFSRDFEKRLESIIPINQLLDEIIYELL